MTVPSVLDHTVVSLFDAFDALISTASADSCLGRILPEPLRDLKERFLEVESFSLNSELVETTSVLSNDGLLLGKSSTKSKTL